MEELQKEILLRWSKFIKRTKYFAVCERLLVIVLYIIGL